MDRSHDLGNNSRFIDYPSMSPDGYYDLKPGETLVFPWQVKPGDHTEMTLTQTDLSAQDNTVQAWLSRRPIDDVMYYPEINYMTDLVVQRSGTTIDVYDDKQHQLTASSGKEYYLNVKNKANEPNAFRVQFSWTVTGTGIGTGNANNSNPNDVNHSEAVGTKTKYGDIVAQFDHGFTLVHSNDNGYDLYNLMKGDDTIASVKVKASSTKGMEDIVAVYVDGSKNESTYLHLMMEWLRDKYGILDIQLMDAGMFKNFWDILVQYPGSIKMALWDKKTGERTSLNREKLDCDPLWSRDPNLYLLIF